MRGFFWALLDLDDLEIAANWPIGMRKRIGRCNEVRRALAEDVAEIEGLGATGSDG